MSLYHFETALHLRPIELQRLESERELEKYHNVYDHHVDPFRERFDTMYVRATVQAPNMDKDTQAAFESAFNRALMHFENDFRSMLMRLQSEKAKRKIDD